MIRVSLKRSQDVDDIVKKFLITLYFNRTIYGFTWISGEKKKKWLMSLLLHGKAPLHNHTLSGKLDAGSTSISHWHGEGKCTSSYCFKGFVCTKGINGLEWPESSEFVLLFWLRDGSWRFSWSDRKEIDKQKYCYYT